MVGPVMAGFSGCTTGSCSTVAWRMASLTRTISPPLSASSATPSVSAFARTKNMPPQATSTVTVPSPATSTFASRWTANAGTFLNSTRVTLPSLQLALTRISPAGASSVSSVTGSCISMIPVSSRTVTTQMVLEPDMGGYSVCSKMMKPASASGWQGGTIALPHRPGLPRGSRSICKRMSSWRAAISCIFSNTLPPRSKGIPPVMTRPGSPSAWASTAWIIRVARMGALR